MAQALSSSPGTAGVFDFRTRQHPSGELRVLAFRGEEEVSKLFCFELTLAAQEADVTRVVAELLGQRASFAMNGGDTGGRVVHGIVRRVEREGVRGPFGQRLRVWLVPRLWLLGRNKQSRIFQDMTVEDIAREVLGQHHLELRFTAVRKLARRAYAVQYEESDLRFLRRLFAEEGLFFTFEHTGDDGLVVCDSAELCKPIAGDPVLSFRETAGMTEHDDHVRELRPRDQVKPGSVLLRDFDFHRPSFEVAARAETPPEQDAFDARSIGIHDHHGDFGRVGIEPRIAQIRLDQERRRARVTTGKSRCFRLATGAWFEVRGAAHVEGDGRFTVVRIEHEGHTPEAGGDSREVYENRFWCVPAELAPLPKKPRRRVRQVLETATVVGPAGQDIHTDAHGRIRVQFHWDLRGHADARSSCWIRVMQAWAGTGFGFQFIPRVGMEALVLFTGGDTDHPMVTGCTYNAAHPWPFPLPGYKSKSGIVTRTTRGGSGYNELSFEDRPNFERVHIHAQRDFDAVVGHNQTTSVVANRTEHVGGNAMNLVTGNELHGVGGNRVHNVAGNDVLVVEGDRTTTTRGNLVETCEGRIERRVVQDEGSHVGGRERRVVEGASETRFGDDQTVRVGGTATTLVGRHDAARSYTLRVEGTTELASTGATEISSDKEVVIRCGKSVLRLAPDHIELSSPAIFLQADGGSAVLGKDEVRLHAKAKALVFSDDKVLLKSVGATVSLTADARIDGATVKLKSPDSEDDPASPPSRPRTKISLKDAAGEPLAYQRFLVLFEDGSERGGILDRAGEAELSLEGDASVVFPDLADIEEA